MDNDILKQLKNYTVLCVEDEDGIRKRLVNTLKYYFDTVIEASNGEEGFDRYYEYKPDMILSDIEMPLESGIDMVKKIRETDSSVCIVMVTAYSNEEYLLELINLNINHYILKPVNSDNLLEGIIKGFGDRLENRLEFGSGLYLDMKRREFIYDDEVVALRKRDKEFLRLLQKNIGTVTLYSDIEDALWIDRSMSMGALKTFIKELRFRLPVDIIENVQQEGYRLKTH